MTRSVEEPVGRLLSILLVLLLLRVLGRVILTVRKVGLLRGLRLLTDRAATILLVLPDMNSRLTTWTTFPLMVLSSVGVTCLSNPPLGKLTTQMLMGLTVMSFFSVALCVVVGRRMSYVFLRG